jgi:hypothetical protein
MEQAVVSLPLGNFKPSEFHRTRIMILSLTRIKFDRKAFFAAATHATGETLALFCSLT